MEGSITTWNSGNAIIIVYQTREREGSITTMLVTSILTIVYQTREREGSITVRRGDDLIT